MTLRVPDVGHPLTVWRQRRLSAVNAPATGDRPLTVIGVADEDVLPRSLGTTGPSHRNVAGEQIQRTILSSPTYEVADHVLVVNRKQLRRRVGFERYEGDLVDTDDRQQAI